ncbi:MAG: VOC family protein [Chloroflexi bacterium]|nr:VOC family protein [Chloroflexota bacterium]
MAIANFPRLLNEKVRNEAGANSRGLTGVDHVGIPCRDALRTGEFVERILGGVEMCRVAFDADARAQGRLPHIFYHVGSQLVEVAEVNDPAILAQLDAATGQPHWAFGTTPQGLIDFMKHLDAEDVPYVGPVLHPGSTSVSAYFRDPDGNMLEVTTWQESPLLDHAELITSAKPPIWQRLKSS